MTSTILLSQEERVLRSGIAEQLATEGSSTKCRACLAGVNWLEVWVPHHKPPKDGVWNGISLENEEAMHVSIARPGATLADGGWRMVACQWCNATDKRIEVSQSQTGVVVASANC